MHINPNLQYSGFCKCFLSQVMAEVWLRSLSVVVTLKIMKLYWLCSLNRGLVVVCLFSAEDMIWWRIRLPFIYTQKLYDEIFSILLLEDDRMVQLFAIVRPSILKNILSTSTFSNQWIIFFLTDPPTLKWIIVTHSGPSVTITRMLGHSGIQDKVLEQLTGFMTYIAAAWCGVFLERYHTALVFSRILKKEHA